MKKILFVVSALAILMGISVSCQKELNNGQAISAGEGTKSSLVVTATIADNGTKVSYAEDGTTPNPGLKPTWEENDIIIGFDNAEPSKTYAYKVTSVDGTTKKATLERITTGDETAIGTATSDPANGTKMYMFYAPGTNPSAINTTEKSLTVSIANQAKDVVPALMMAEATVTDGSLSLSFKNKTAIIGIKNPTMAEASTNYTSIALSGSGINTEVKFDLSGTDGALKASYQTSGTITKAVQFKSSTSKEGPGVIYIVACPLETSANLTFNTNNGEKFIKTGKTMAAGNYYYMTPTFGKFHFTVDASNKDVEFAPGNLYAKKGTGGNWSWGFYEKQYQFHSSSMPEISTSGGSRTAAEGDTEIDLFTWGYDNTSTNNSYSLNPINTAGITGHDTEDNKQLNPSTDGDDWGVAYCNSNNITVGTWRTLTKAEWEWLLGPSSSPNPGTNCRTSSTVNGTSNARYLKCKVNDGTEDVYGLMIFPDTFIWPTDTDDPSAPTGSYINKKNLNWTATDFPGYTSSEFEALEKAGVVFLPAAGNRYGASVSNVGSNGGYWSSSAYSSTNVYGLNFTYKKVDPANYFDRDSGRSVRLVSVVQ